MTEVWRKFRGYPYSVSNTGKIRSDRYNRILRQEVVHRGYARVAFCVNNKYERFLVHRLVAKAFIPNPKRYPIVNHKNAKQLDNNVTNLEWTSYSENLFHAYKNHITKKIPYKEREIIVNSTKTKYRLAREYNVTWSSIDYIFKTYKKDGLAIAPERKKK